MLFAWSAREELDAQEAREVPVGWKASMVALLAWGAMVELLAQGSGKMLTVQGAKLVPVAQGGAGIGDSEMASLAVSERSGVSGTISMTVSQKTETSEHGTVPVNIMSIVVVIVTATIEQGELEIQSASVAEKRDLEAQEILTASLRRCRRPENRESGRPRQPSRYSPTPTFYLWQLRVCVQSRHT